MCWEEFMLASDAELDEEFDWAISREGSCFKRGIDKFGEFAAALTKFEKKNQADYPRMFPDVTIALLEQCPDTHKQCSSSDHTTMTIIKGLGMAWSYRRSRWLTPFEVLALMGFPSYRALRAYGGTCSFSIEREDVGLKPRRRRAIVSQAGNSMFVPIAGMSLLYVCLRVANEGAGGAGNPNSLLSLASSSATRELKRKRSAPTLSPNKNKK